MKRNIFLPIFIAFSCLLSCTIAMAQDKALPQLEITYDETALNSDFYIVGTMDLTDTDGTNWQLTTKFKKRGATALQYKGKPSLNMKLEDADGKELDTDLMGLRKASSFILDAMAVDRINMRNRIAFDIWNDFSRLPYDTDFGGRNGTVGKFVEMYINGNYKGIYCLSDKINRKLLDLKKPEIDEETGDVTIRGILYKNGTNDIANQNNPGYFNDYLVWVAQYHDAWELHEPEDYASEEAWAPLAELYADRHFLDYSYVKDHFWLENLADYTIHVMALCIADNWGTKNRYFSIQNVTKDDDRSRFVVTPWDLDTSFGGEYDGSCFGTNLKEDWTVSDIEKSVTLPLWPCFGEPEFRKLMKNRWLEGRIGAFSVESVRQRLEQTAALFVESGAWQRTLQAANPHDLVVDDLLEEVRLIGNWYEKRFTDMDTYFQVTQEDIAGVSFTESENREPEIYNLQGLRLQDASTPGIYIIGGRKVVVR